jgi:hypothetical protein
MEEAMKTKIYIILLGIFLMVGIVNDLAAAHRATEWHAVSNPQRK